MIPEPSPEQVEINVDGTAKMGGDEGINDGDAGAEDNGGEEVFNSTSGDFNFFVLFLIILVAGGGTLYYMYRKRQDENKKFEFFEQLEGSTFNVQLPPTIDEFYVVKAKAIKDGWVPGQGEPSKEKTDTPGRRCGQALMKRAISIVPILHLLQKEGQAMTRLHQKNMCSEAQWRSFKSMEGMVSEELEEVKSEAEEIEPGWSQAIWQQAGQYHQMLKRKKEQEQMVLRQNQAKQAQQQQLTDMKAEAEQRKRAEIQKAVDAARNQEKNAEKIAEQLLKEEERKQGSKTAFKGGVKKGFLK